MDRLGPWENSPQFDTGRGRESESRRDLSIVLSELVFLTVKPACVYSYYYKVGYRSRRGLINCYQSLDLCIINLV